MFWELAQARQAQQPEEALMCLHTAEIGFHQARTGFHQVQVAKEVAQDQEEEYQERSPRLHVIE